ncbi:hypothetical protein ACSBR1_026718 [Camellia fascicularis]
MKVDGESKRFHSLIWASFGSSPDPKFWLGICILPIWPFGDSLGPSPSLGRNHGIILCKSWVAQSRYGALLLEYFYKLELFNYQLLQ